MRRAAPARALVPWAIGSLAVALALLTATYLVALAEGDGGERGPGAGGESDHGAGPACLRTFASAS